VAAGGDRERELEVVDLLAGLEPRERARIAGLCRFQRVAAGATVLAREEEGSDLVFVLEGSLEVIEILPGGRAISLALVEAGGHVGELAAIDGGPRAAAVRAREASRLARLDAANFRRLLERHPGIAGRLLRDLVRIIRLSNLRIGELAGLRVVQRLARHLLEQARMEEGRWVLRPAPTQEEMAAALATTRETVARALARLRAADLVRRRGRTLHLPDHARLLAVIGSREDGGPLR